MKNLGLLLLCALLPACAMNTTVGPKPDVAPVRVSNKATRASIKKARSSIKEAQTKQAEGDTALEKAHNYLSQLLNEK
jgi:hypothetical protein